MYKFDIRLEERLIKASGKELDRYSKSLTGNSNCSTPVTVDDFDGDIMSVVPTSRPSRNRAFADRPLL